MFLIGKGIDRGNAAIFGEIHHVTLGKSPDHGAMDHTPQYAGGILDGFPTTKLNVVGCEEQYVASEFTNADLETDTRTRGGFREHEGPALVSERVTFVVAPGRLHIGGQRKNAFNLLSGEGFDV